VLFPVTLRNGCLPGGCHIGTVPGVGIGDVDIVDRVELIALVTLDAETVQVPLVDMTLLATGCLFGGFQIGMVFCVGIADVDVINRVDLVIFAAADPANVPLLEVRLEAMGCLCGGRHTGIDRTGTTAAAGFRAVGFGTSIFADPEDDIVREEYERCGFEAVETKDIENVVFRDVISALFLVVIDVAEVDFTSDFEEVKVDTVACVDFELEAVNVDLAEDFKELGRYFEVVTVDLEGILDDGDVGSNFDVVAVDPKEALDVGEEISSDLKVVRLDVGETLDVDDVYCGLEVVLA
jgi:hypothetical protein